jgi:hypothetical protein
LANEIEQKVEALHVALNLRKKELLQRSATIQTKKGNVLDWLLTQISVMALTEQLQAVETLSACLEHKSKQHVRATESTNPNKILIIARDLKSTVQVPPRQLSWLNLAAVK